MGGVRHFINILDHESDELRGLLSRAEELKLRLKHGIQDRPLVGKCLAMFFEKPSTRTRVSLEAAMTSLGGTAINLEGNEGPGARLGDRERLDDVARVVSRYVAAITIRTFEHQKVEMLAKFSDVPVINALSDWSHPTQAMADLLTMQERFGDLSDATLAYVGDGNNVARSLAALCGKLGVRFVAASPAGYQLGDEFLQSVKTVCPEAELEVTDDPSAAVKDAWAVYTDVWASMGQEDEAEKRDEIFRPYQLNAALMASARKNAIALHCLPAHRGQEITDEIMDSPASAVFDQAENRMHVNRALLDELVEHAHGSSK